MTKKDEILDTFFCLIMNENLLLYNFLSSFFHLIASLTDMWQANHQGAERYIENNVYRLPRVPLTTLWLLPLARSPNLFPTLLGAC